ncbi:hypothetical protein BKA93DRAFT_754647 [Sparassis latifolia]
MWEQLDDEKKAGTQNLRNRSCHAKQWPTPHKTNGKIGNGSASLVQHEDRGLEGEGQMKKAMGFAKQGVATVERNQPKGNGKLTSKTGRRESEGKGGQGEEKGGEEAREEGARMATALPGEEVRADICTLMAPIMQDVNDMPATSPARGAQAHNSLTPTRLTVYVTNHPTAQVALMDPSALMHHSCAVEPTAATVQDADVTPDMLPVLRAHHAVCTMNHPMVPTDSSTMEPTAAEVQEADDVPAMLPTLGGCVTTVP